MPALISRAANEIQRKSQQCACRVDRKQELGSAALRNLTVQPNAID